MPSGYCIICREPYKVDYYFCRDCYRRIDQLDVSLHQGIKPKEFLVWMSCGLAEDLARVFEQEEKAGEKPEPQTLGDA